jgi:hypothetical protein
LGLVVTAITLSNTVYLEKAVDALRQHGTQDEKLLPPISPQGWEHIDSTGDYVWPTDKRVRRDVSDCCAVRPSNH